MGAKWEKNGTKYPFFTVPFFVFLRRSKILPTVPFVKEQLTALTEGKLGNFATHGYSPPRPLVRMHDTMTPRGQACLLMVPYLLFGDHPDHDDHKVHR